MNYLVNKNSHGDKILNIEELDGYVFRPKLNNDSFIKVNEVKIVDNVMTDKIFTIKFDKAFRKLVTLAMNVISDDDATDDDVGIVLDEAQLVKEILLNKYEAYLSKEKKELFLKKIRVIEQEMRLKQVAIKEYLMYREMQSEKSVSRGR